MVLEYEAGDMRALCQAVLARLSATLTDELNRLKILGLPDLELAAQNSFAEERSRILVGRRPALDGVAEYLRGNERRPLVIYGESGSGKSAVMAKASEAFSSEARTLRRFIGVSPQSATGRAILAGLCRDLADDPANYGSPVRPRSTGKSIPGKSTVEIRR